VTLRGTWPSTGSPFSRTYDALTTNEDLHKGARFGQPGWALVHSLSASTTTDHNKSEIRDFMA